MSSGDRTQEAGLSNKCLYPRSHPANPQVLLLSKKVAKARVCKAWASLKWLQMKILMFQITECNHVGKLQGNWQGAASNSLNAKRSDQRRPED